MPLHLPLRPPSSCIARVKGDAAAHILHGREEETRTEQDERNGERRSCIPERGELNDVDCDADALRLPDLEFLRGGGRAGVVNLDERIKASVRSAYCTAAKACGCYQQVSTLGSGDDIVVAISEARAGDSGAMPLECLQAFTGYQPGLVSSEVPPQRQLDFDSSQDVQVE